MLSIFRSSWHYCFLLLFHCYLVVCNFLNKDQKQYPIIFTKVEFLKSWPWFYSCLFILFTSRFKKLCWKKQAKITLFHLIHCKNPFIGMPNLSKLRLDLSLIFNSSFPLLCFCWPTLKPIQSLVLKFCLRKKLSFTWMPNWHLHCQLPGVWFPV